MGYNPFQQSSGIQQGTPQQLQNAYNNHLSQAQAMAQLNQYAQQARERSRWMINGEPMTFREFADTLFPDDSPAKTMFFLKYSKDE